MHYIPKTFFSLDAEDTAVFVLRYGRATTIKDGYVFPGNLANEISRLSTSNIAVVVVVVVVVEVVVVVVVIPSSSVKSTTADDSVYKTKSNKYYDLLFTIKRKKFLRTNTIIQSSPI